MMGSRIACAVALILACAFAEPNVTALLDLVEVAAITKNATRLAAFEDALADVKAQRDVKFADPTAVSTKAARRKLTVRDFLERHRHLYDAQYDDVVARVAAFLEEHAGVGLDDDPGDPAANKPAESADAPAEVESATAPPPEEDAAEGRQTRAAAATTPPEEDAAAAPPPERKARSRASGGGSGTRSGGAASPGERARVSFEAHGALVDEGLTVYEACGKLQTKASKYLVVRFGLHPLLWRPVGSVSTGEIRKVLLARALARKPDLLLLDNAYDGLDAPSRAALAKLLSQMLTGFSALLVQDVPSGAEAARSQRQVDAGRAPRAAARGPRLVPDGPERRPRGSLEVLGVDVARGGAAAVAWVSTELHLALAARADAASVVARCFGATAGAAAYVLEAGFGVGAAALDRPFRALSQGEQKLVLVAGAVAAKPELLVLDEVCQGPTRRTAARCARGRRRAARLVFISHHWDEILPCVTHVLDLAQNEAPTFVGEMRAWTPP
ncbi:ATPase [Aureococcus anophagefferens]|nr:ATPase [Aureococcus anophagefferens]